MAESDIRFQGDLSLWWSLLIPNPTTPLSSISNEIKEWIQQEFLCEETVHEMGNVRLVSDILLTSACLDDTGLTRRQLALPADMTLLWNEPNITASTQVLWSNGVNLMYMQWNASFPVYEWGSGNDSREVQSVLQNLLEEKIWHGDIGIPLDNGLLSVSGEEHYFFVEKPRTNPVFDPRIDARDSNIMMITGASLFLINTALIGLLQLLGKGIRREKRELLMKDPESFNNMLRLSKGFVEIKGAAQETERIVLEEKEKYVAVATKEEMTCQQWYERPSSPGILQDAALEHDEENQIAEKMQYFETKRKKRKPTKRELLMKDPESFNNMLRLSKGFVELKGAARETARIVLEETEKSIAVATKEEMTCQQWNERPSSPGILQDAALEHDEENRIAENIQSFETKEKKSMPSTKETSPRHLKSSSKEKKKEKRSSKSKKKKRRSSTSDGNHSKASRYKKGKKKINEIESHNLVDHTSSISLNL